MGGSNKKRQVFVIGFRNQRILLGKNGLELTSYYFMWKSYIVFFFVYYLFLRSIILEWGWNAYAETYYTSANVRRSGATRLSKMKRTAFGCVSA